MKLTRKEMDHFTVETLHALVGITESPCVSIYMPTHQCSVETEQDPIRPKNLLSDVETRLLDAGIRRPDVERLLAPIQQLLEERSFWRHQSDGLAVFGTNRAFHTLRLPESFEEFTIMGERPNIIPLLPLLSSNGLFYLLAISQNQVRFYKSNRYEIGEIELTDTPASLEEAMRFDQYQSQLQFHTGTGA